MGFGAPGGARVDRRLWRRKGDERVAAVEKIEDQRKPEDFFGYRNRIAPYGGYISVYLKVLSKVGGRIWDWGRFAGAFPAR